MGSGPVAARPEGRQSPWHSWKKVGDAVLLGAAVQIPNLHPLEAACRQGVFAQRIGALREDTLGYALQRQDPAPVFALGCEVARRLKRNGVLRSDGARGRRVAAVDGIEICRSFLPCCDACMERPEGESTRTPDGSPAAHGGAGRNHSVQPAGGRPTLARAGSLLAGGGSLPACRQDLPRAEGAPGAGDPEGIRREEKDSAGPSTNYYATHLELGSIPPRFLHELGRSRWRVDAEVFQTLTPQAHLKPPSVPQTGALVMLTLIRVLSYTLSRVFYHRQVVSQARQTPPTFSEMARLLAYLFLTPRLDTS